MDITITDLGDGGGKVRGELMNQGVNLCFADCALNGIIMNDEASDGMWIITQDGFVKMPEGPRCISIMVVICREWPFL